MARSRAETVFARYSAALRGFISKRLSSQDDSEDILHDLFYRFVVSDGEQEAIDNVSAWLYRVARNLIVDRSRKIRETPMPYLADAEDDESSKISFADLFLCAEDDVEDELLRSLLRDEIELALSELPAEQRSVFELNELQGIPFNEISAATGTAVNTLISRKRYAVLHLRRRLQSLRDEFLVD